MRFVVLCYLAAICSPALAEEVNQDQFEAALIRSNQPLYAFDWPEFWPRSHADEESIACITRVSFGDWQFTRNPENEMGFPRWLGFKHHGVIHCNASIYWANSRAALLQGRPAKGAFILIGETEWANTNWELWIIQEHRLGQEGSEYTLLARTADKTRIIEEFRVLQRRCSAAQMRLGSMAQTGTLRYCAVETKDELLELMQRMLTEPPLGTLSLVKGKGPDETPDPSNSETQE